jgi:predicted glutamine amidotransferase
MARLVGFIANRPDLCNRFAEHEDGALSVANHGGEPWGWGVGFYQSGEILLKRRPIDDRTRLSVADMISEVRSDLIAVHVRRATVGTLRTDNTHPFRYQQWMFADTGTVAGFAQAPDGGSGVRHKMLESLPDFLQRGLRGDTDSELLFNLFLSFLHDAGKLDHPVVGARDVFAALKSSVGLVNRITREAGLPPAQVNVLLATPDYLVAAHYGAPMAYRVLRGREDLEPLFAEEGPGKLRMPDLEPCRLCVVASDFEGGKVPEEWTPLTEGSMIAFTRTDDPIVATK